MFSHVFFNTLIVICDTLLHEQLLEQMDEQSVQCVRVKETQEGRKETEAASGIMRSVVQGYIRSFLIRCGIDLP